MFGINEWNNIVSVFIGSVTNSNFPEIDSSLRLINLSQENDAEKFPTADQILGGEFLDETRQDLDNLADFFISAGLEAIRPNVEVKSTYNYFTPRDLLFVYDDIMLVCPTPLRYRAEEFRGYRTELIDNWNFLPKGISQDFEYKFYSPAVARSEKSYNHNSLKDKTILALNENEPLFEACNILKANDHVFYLVNNRANLAGARLLQDILGDKAKVVVIENLCKHTKLNNCISFIREGLLMINPHVVQSKEQLPKQLKSWDVITAPTEAPYDQPHFDKSVYTNMNLFMVRPDLAIVESQQIELAKLLEQNKIEVKLMRIRNTKRFGGNLHSIILDHDRN